MNRLSQLRDRFLMNERFSAAVNAVIVVAMMTCVATMAIQVVERLLPGWNGGHWAGVALVVALESVLSTRLANRLNLSVWNSALYRLTELVVIFIALKIVVYAWAGWGQLLADIPRWQSDFNTFFTGEYVFACVLNGGIWLGSWMMASAALDLEGDVLLLERDRGVIENSRTDARRRLAGQVFGIGALLLVMVALVRSNLSLLGIQAPALQSSLISILLYFVLGLLLISQAHFAVLRATWSLEHISISPGMAQRWTAYSVAMLIGVAAMVALLPTRPDPETCVQIIEKFRATIFFAVPTFYGQMLNACQAADLASVRLGISAGEALPPELYHRWKARFGVDILDGIGTTELLHIFICNHPGDLRDFDVVFADQTATETATRANKVHRDARSGYSGSDATGIHVRNLTG